MGFAVGIVVALVGIVVSLSLVVVGAVIALIFAALWVRDLARGSDLTHADEVEPETRAEPERAPALADVRGDHRYSRSVFLELSTLGLGAVIGGLVTVPALGFMIGPAFLKQGQPDHDLGPLTDFPEGKFLVTTYTSNPEAGVRLAPDGVHPQQRVPRQPAELHDHLEPLRAPRLPGPAERAARGGPPVPRRDDAPVQPSGFGCPCHGGQYDTEGNRIAGPPVRALDRYSFSIRDSHLYIGSAFSVAKVEGVGATAKIFKHPLAFPGAHVSGLESWLYPITPR